MNSPQLHQLTERVYWMDPDETTDRPILGAVTGTQGTLMVEAGNSPAHVTLFLNALKAQQIAPPTFLTATHWHWDHVFGASAVDAPFIAHRETRRMVRKLASLDWNDAALDRRVEEGTEIPFCRDMVKAEFSEQARQELVIRPPEIAFTTAVELDLGGVTCHLINVGGDHGSDNSIVYIPEERVIFLGDCMYESYYPGPVHYTIDKFFPLVETLLSYDAEYYLFAHAPVPMSDSEMVGYTNWLKTIANTVEQIGPHKERVMAELEALTEETLAEDDEEVINTFIAGLSRAREQV